MSFTKANEKARQELLYLANIEIGFHEQTRLQPEIFESLNAALANEEEITKFVTNVLLTNLGWAGKLIYRIALLRGKKSLLKRAISFFVVAAQPHLRRMLTAVLMTLTIPPNRCLHLGQGITATFPSNLQYLENAELQALLKQIDPSPDSLSQTGATDWSDLI